MFPRYRKAVWRESRRFLRTASIKIVRLFIRVAGSPEPPPAKGCNTREARSCPRWLRALTCKLKVELKYKFPRQRAGRTPPHGRPGAARHSSRAVTTRDLRASDRRNNRTVIYPEPRTAGNGENGRLSGFAGQASGRNIPEAARAGDVRNDKKRYLCPTYGRLSARGRVLSLYAPSDLDAAGTRGAADRIGIGVGFRNGVFLALAGRNARPRRVGQRSLQSRRETAARQRPAAFHHPDYEQPGQYRSHPDGRLRHRPHRRVRRSLRPGIYRQGHRRDLHSVAVRRNHAQNIRRLQHPLFRS